MPFAGTFTRRGESAGLLPARPPLPLPSRPRAVPPPRRDPPCRCRHYSLLRPHGWASATGNRRLTRKGVTSPSGHQLKAGLGIRPRCRAAWQTSAARICCALRAGRGMRRKPTRSSVTQRRGSLTLPPGLSPCSVYAGVLDTLKNKCWSEKLTLTLPAFKLAVSLRLLHKSGPRVHKLVFFAPLQH